MTTPADRDEWIRMCRKGYTAKRIADRYGVTQREVHQFLMSVGAYRL